MKTKPFWIRTKRPDSGAFNRVNNLLERYNVHTVCKSARCPNTGECFSRNHLTFMILGDVCTRRCRFCSVKKGDPEPVNCKEIGQITEIVGLMNMDYVVITSVTRDDLPDGGVGLYCKVIEALKEKHRDIKIEILTPDFYGKCFDDLLCAAPYVWAHNVETVPRLYKEIRPQADYIRSLKLLSEIKTKRNDIFTKSGIMLGLGETESEILDVLCDLRDAGVDIVTLGQYLKPSKESVNVERFLTPLEFEEYRKKAVNIGFKYVQSAPLVRSSYRINDKL
jgi:lipoic acid synthetase